MKFSVTGASGFFGRYICRELLDKGHDVRACVHRPERTGGLDALGAEIYVGDFDRWEDVVGMMKGSDAVIQNGYWQSGDPINFAKYVEYNLLGLYKMLEYCRDNRINNFFYVSSGAAIGGNAMPTLQKRKNRTCAPMPLDEDYPSAPDTEYAALKRSSESYVATFNKQYGMHHFTAFRPMGDIMGLPVRDVRRTCLYKETWAMLHNEPVYTDLEHDFATVHPRDFARAAMTIAEKPLDEPVYPLYHVLGEVCPRQQIMETIKQLTNSKSEFFQSPPAKPVIEISSSARVRKLGVELCGLQGLIEQTTELMQLHAENRLPKP